MSFQKVRKLLTIMQHNYIYFLYGLCCMFYIVMAWFFWRKRNERLSRFVSALMLIIALQCIKDVFVLPDALYDSTRLWSVITAVDMVAVPFYAFILMELCRPGFVSARLMVLHILPFMVLPALYIITGRDLFYAIEVVWAGIYGVSYAIWTIFAIKRYNVRLRQQYSFEENINLDWLRIILVFFFVILSIWIADCIVINVNIENVYMICSLVMGVFLCYFINRHENVIRDLRTPAAEECIVVEESEMSVRITRLFEEEHVYLNPNLKLTDIALMIGSNRTYVSRFFNAEKNTTFFDYVNGYRIRRAEELLRNTDEKIEVIAELAGFNSRQALHRVFSKTRGVTPEKYRMQE